MTDTITDTISVFGARGFIGSRYCAAYPDKTWPIPRVQRNPVTKDILWFISTTDNYNVFGDLTLDVETNLITMLETLRFCRGGDYTFNFISSWFVYGKCDQLPASEDFECRPTGFYSITKRCAEQLLISFCETHNMKYRILRLGNVYGRGDLGASKKKNAIQHMIQKIRNGEPVDLYNGGTGRRDLIHVDDVVRAIDLVISNGEINTIYNIGSGVGTSVRDMILAAKQLAQSSSEIRSIPTPTFHQQVQVEDFYLDVSRLTKLGFEPQISITEGIRELLSS